MSIKRQLQGRVLTLSVNRPERKNALTQAMYQQLAEYLEAAESDAAVKVVVLTGDAQCFTSGNDLKDFLEHPPTGLDSPTYRFMCALLDLSKPLLAAVAGPAVGIGTTLLLHCDLVYVARDALLKTPFAALGLTPEFASSLLLPRLLGRARASALLLASESITGEQAAQWGLVSEALESGEAALDKAAQVAQRLAQGASGALKASRTMMLGDRAGLRAYLEAEWLAFVRKLAEPEAREAFLAFAERRPADFSGI